MISDWKNKKVAVLGLGIEGLSSVKYLSGLGAAITILDSKKEREIDDEILSLTKKLNLDFYLGTNYLDNLARFETIVRSPGISIYRKELQQAKENGVEITSQTKLFFDFCPCPIIGVTGTKGKGTTSSLIYEMLKTAGYDAYLGGNIGKPPFEFLGNLTLQSIVVLELSSFQLQDLERSPHIAVMLMITSEHLDYHGDTGEYVEAKRNLIRFQRAEDFAILNRDYPATNESNIHTAGKIYFVSRERFVAEGCFIKNDKVVISGIFERVVIDTENILLPGKHNLENVCAAVMAAALAGAPLDAIRKVLSSFKGLEHRLELVREVGGVKYYDDSFSTTPETAIAAIEAFKEPEILILGGSSKKSDFTELGEVISKAKNIKAIIGVGVEWERIKSQIFPLRQGFAGQANLKSQNHNSNLKSEILLIEGAKNMSTIVAAASKIAEKGDVVLLSPACASFDMFKNYKDRGEQFKREVVRLA